MNRENHSRRQARLRFAAVAALGSAWPLRVRAAEDWGAVQDAEAASGAGPIALVRPEAIRLEPGTGAASGVGNRLAGRVVSSMYLGPQIEYLIDAAGTQVRAFSRQDFPPDCLVTLSFSAQDCLLIEDRALGTRHAA